MSFYCAHRQCSIPECPRCIHACCSSMLHDPQRPPVSDHSRRFLLTVTVTSLPMLSPNCEESSFSTSHNISAVTTMPELHFKCNKVRRAPPQVEVPPVNAEEALLLNHCLELLLNIIATYECATLQTQGPAHMHMCPACSNCAVLLQCDRQMYRTVPYCDRQSHSCQLSAALQSSLAEKLRSAHVVCISAR